MNANQGLVIPSPPRIRFLRGVGRIWLLSAMLGALTVGVAALTRHGGSFPTPIFVPWWIVAGGFALVEVFVIHVEIRREAYSLSLSEVPLTIGLFFLSPIELVIAQCVGAATALVFHRRQSAMKLAFNVSHLGLEAALAAVVFAGVTDRLDPSSPSVWGAAFLATSVAGLVADVAVHGAISLAESRVDLRALANGFVTTHAMQLANTSVGLLMVQLLWAAPASTMLVGIPTVSLLVSYRAYNKQRKRRQALQFLHETTRRLDEASDLDAAVEVVLRQARDMLRAEVSELVYFSTDAEPSRRWQLGPGDGLRAEAGIELDPTQGVWARIAAEEQPVLLAKPIANARLAEHFWSKGIKDAIVAPLKGEVTCDGIRVHGLMLVGNHLSEVATFDEDDLHLLSALAHSADAALQNARLVNRLRASVADLQEVNRLKDEFVAVVSHELRTPLTVISGAIKTLVRYGATVSSDDRQVLITSADRASDRLRALIEQLLTASRLEHLTIESQAIELAAVASAVAADFGPATDRLQIRVSPELPRVLGDPALVQRILSNLVDNALKYSPPDSRVSVDARAESRDVVVSVRDQGPGIPEDAQSRVFERFFQVDSSSTRSVGGVGLGLYISRSLAEQIGGSLQLESSNERGSVFALTLPIAEPSTDVTSTAERMSCARGGRRTPNAPIRSPDGPSGARQPS